MVRSAEASPRVPAIDAAHPLQASSGSVWGGALGKSIRDFKGSTAETDRLPGAVAHAPSESAAAVGGARKLRADEI